MGNTFKYTLLELIRMPGIMVWALGFPLILSTVFVLMFSPPEDMTEMNSVPLVVVEPGDSAEVAAFETFVEAVSEEGCENGEGAAETAAEADTEPGANADSQDGGSALLKVTYAPSAEDAERLVLDSQSGDDPFVGYVELVDGLPRAHVVGAVSATGTEGLQSTLVVMLMDQYVANKALFREVMASNPAAFADPGFAASLFQPIRATVQTEVTENQPKETVRFYFALLGMAALFGGTLGLVACQRLKPDTSPLGARRSIGAVTHGRTVAATLVASWCVTFACLVVTYFYMRIVAGIDFGGRDAACLVALAASALMATSLGSAVSAIPRLPESAKSGILTGIVCFSSLFAGLYGQPTMELADMIAKNIPVVVLVNPASQIAHSFYSIMYYDTYLPLALHVGVLLLMTLALFCLSARSLRRHRYASL